MTTVLSPNTGIASKIDNNTYSYNKPVNMNSKSNNNNDDLWYRSNMNKLNAFIITKKMQQQYWKLDRLVDSDTIVTDMDTLSDTIVMSNKNTLQFFTLQKDTIYKDQRYSVNLKRLQNVSIPDPPISKIKLFDINHSNPFYHYKQDDDDNNNNSFILTGHTNGKVNLIISNKDNSKIVEKFKHNRFFGNNNNVKDFLPIQQIEYHDDLNYFISKINDYMFIYDINNKRKPIIMRKFNGLQNFNISRENSNNIFLNRIDGIDLFDLRQPTVNNLQIFKQNPHTYQINCLEILNNHSIAMGTTDGIKFLDTRNGKISTETVNINNVKQLQLNNSNTELNCLETSGFVTKWDLSNISQTKMSLKSNSKKIPYHKQNYTNEPVIENGDLILNNHDTTCLSNWGNNLVTLGVQDLGIHQIIDVKIPINKIDHSTPISQQTNNLQDTKLTKTNSNVSWNSDDTTPRNSVTSLRAF